MAVAVVAAALILALTVTSGRISRVPMLAMVMFGDRPADVAAVQEAAESVASHRPPDIGPAVPTGSGPTMEATAGTRSTGVRLAARDGFAAHIQVLERAGGDGAWLPDTAARSLGLRAGQALRLGPPPGARVGVTGVYRDLAAGGRPLEPYWSPLASAVHTLSVTMDTPPPPVLVDPDRFLAVRALAAKGSCCLVATHSEELLAGVDRVLAISDGRLLGRP